MFSSFLERFLNMFRTSSTPSLLTDTLRRAHSFQQDEFTNQQQRQRQEQEIEEKKLDLERQKLELRSMKLDLALKEAETIAKLKALGSDVSHLLD
jgi:hypothetical protein